MYKVIYVDDRRETHMAQLNESEKNYLIENDYNVISCKKI